MSSSLALISGYNSDSDEEDKVPTLKIEQTEQENVDQQVRLLLDTLLTNVATRVDAEAFSTYRTTCDDHELLLSSSDCESSSTSSWSLSSDVDSDEESMQQSDSPSKPKPYRAPKTKGELGLDDLPPIQHLDINVQTEHLVHFGRVATIVDRLVSVLSFKNMPALDLDSVLFMKSGRPLGSVFDVFGPVAQPIYVIRFNTEEEISAYGVKVDMPVYFVPTLGDPLTKFVFVHQLMQEKGSDASWEHNNEPPEECRDFSDDEDERAAKNNSSKKRVHACTK